MERRIIDTKLWIDFSRRETSKELKAFIAPWLLDSAAMICEPIAFELLHQSSSQMRRQTTAQLKTYPSLETPTNLWRDSIENGQICRDQGVTPGSLDLLIATLAIHHDAELVTFDTDFTDIARCLPLRLNLLTRPK